MPSRSDTNWSGRSKAWLSMLVVVACATGCSPLAVSNRCVVTDPIVASGVSDTTVASPVPSELCGSPQGTCTCGACPPVCKKPWRWPRLPRLLHPHRLLWCFGPLLHWGPTPEEEALMEAELYPPHSRFHPVPTAPVFAQRAEYLPPESMMQAVPERPFPHLTPPLNPVPAQSVPSHASPAQSEPGPLFVPRADSPAEAIPPGPTDSQFNRGGTDIRDYESEGRRPGSVRLSRT
jgi:hypothetical protein